MNVAERFVGGYCQSPRMLTEVSQQRLQGHHDEETEWPDIITEGE